MKKSRKLFLINLLLIQSLGILAQTHYEKGYFISNDGNKTQCLIKNDDWYQNPTEFKYKLLMNNAIHIAKVDDVKEFAFDKQPKFIRANVNLDTSPPDLEHMSDSRNPQWEKRTAFLKVLVEGKAELYSYKEKEIERFFYKKDDSSIEQLVYKEYYKRDPITSNISTAVNDTFKIQLINNIMCEKSNNYSVEDPKYYESDLKRYFIKYNQCMDPNFKVIKDTIKRDLLNINLFTGISSTSLSISNDWDIYESADFKRKQTLKIGAGIEYIMPFANNKWSVLTEIEYDSFISNYQSEVANGNIDYKNLSLSVGAKYTFFLNTEWKLFFKGAIHSIYTNDFNSNCYIHAYNVNDGTSYSIKDGMNVAISIGAEYKRCYAELKYYTNQDVMTDYLYFITKMEKISICFGYEIFKLSSGGNK